mmetsp:Transcript_28686/g.58291  ORF Transcript_28686/g.58291 Transcript_28686/m.58291 type:complete len:87 (+) Transcript_28686:1-261(+)
MGRMALDPSKEHEQDFNNTEKKPKISSSVPFSWPFIMLGRAAKAGKNKSPSPWDLPGILEAEIIQVQVDSLQSSKTRKDQTAPTKA